MVDAEAFQIFHFEVFQQLFRSRTFGKDPVVQLERKKLCSEITLKQIPFSTLEKHFFRRKIPQEFVYIFSRTLCREKLSRADIQKGYAANILIEMYGSKEIVFLVTQYIVIH